MSDEVGEEREETHRARPEHLHTHAGLRAHVGREQLARHDEAHQDDSLQRNTTVHSHMRCYCFISVDFTA